MPFNLKHIKKWNALEIKQNGKNTSSNYARYMQFMDSIPNKVAVDDYTWLIPDSYIDDWMSRFSFITTMTQTLGSIKGNEEPIMPDISYEPKHLDKLKLTPYPFQHIGIAYLVSVKAGIIGDEMGLGKTIQGIGASHELIQEGKVKKVVVVPPASLKYQWAEEIKKFTDYTSIVVDGTKKQRTNQYAQFSRESVQFLIVGYETIRNDIDMVKELEFDCICLDEAQKIKNRQTKTYKAITQLNPEYKFLLTGTPMQNRPDEIHALMSWLDQDVLGKITQFRKKHVVTGEKFGRRFMDLGYKNLDEIRERISPRLLRRMKQEVAPDLPDMLYSIVRADMTKPQKELYDAVATDFKFLQEELQEFYANQSEQDAAQFKKSKDEDKVLGYMYMLQAIADHPLLLARGKSKMAQKYLPLVRKARSSPKLDELIETLTPQIEAGEDIVIFSRFVTMLELIHKEIMKHFNQEPYVIHGGVKPKARQEQVNDFKENPTRQIMLLSDAGNSGLNLENASSLIHYDMPWTASTFDQRSNRIHRLNSEFESVNIISMVLNDSIDEQVMRTIEHKRNLSDGLIERNQSEQDIMKQLLDELE